MNSIFRTIIKGITAIAIAALLVFIQLPTPAYAAQITSLSQLDQARVSFTFDDGFASTRTIAAPILEERGIDGVLYLTSGSADGTLSLDDNQPGASWDQVRELQSTYGWEIGGHMQTHPEMPTLTPAQNVAEIAQSNAAFAANGLNVTNFASPFGAYDNATLTEILKYYKSHRGFADIGYNAAPSNKAVLMVQDVNQSVTLAQVQAWIDHAVANRQWLILVFHDVAPQTNANYTYTTTTGDLTAIADYVQARTATGQLRTVTTEQGITIPGTNVLQNSGFEAGLTTGWTTDNAEVVKADSTNHGNYGSPEQSISMTGAATAGHLFSTVTPVSTTTSYVLDTFVNTTGLTAGELGFYIDEYNAQGTWIATQALGPVTNGTVGFYTRLYNTSSATVSSVRVQASLSAGAAGTAYVDSTNLYNVDGSIAASVTPVTSTEVPVQSLVQPEPTVTPEPTSAPVATESAQVQETSISNEERPTNQESPETVTPTEEN